MIHTICSQTTPSAVVVTEIKGDRIVPAGELSEVFAKYTDAQIVTEPDIEKAFERACTLRQDGLLFCAGSLYLVGRSKKSWKNARHDKGADFMINYEEELKKFHSSLDVNEAEDAIYNRDLTDITDILKELMKDEKRR